MAKVRTACGQVLLRFTKTRNEITLLVAMYITDISSLCSLITTTTTTPTAQRASQNRTLTASAASALQAPFTPGCPARYYPTVPLQLVEVKAFCYVLVTAQRADVPDNTELDSNSGAVAVRQRGKAREHCNNYEKMKQCSKVKMTTCVAG